MKLKFNLIAGLLGLMMAIPGAVMAQVPEDQSNQDAKPSPNVQMPGPSDQSSMEQDSMDQGSTDQDSMDQGSTEQGASDQGLNQSPKGGPSDSGSSVPTSNAPA